MGKIVIRINHKEFEKILYEEDMSHYTAEVSLEILAAAREIYLAERVLPDHNDYLDSFKLKKKGKSFLVQNTNPHAFWVEFGAHAGGVTPILGYAPLRRAIDAVAAKH